MQYKTSNISYPANINSRVFSFREYFSIVFFIIFSISLFSGSKISGIIYDESGIPISDVNIELLPTSFGSVSDERGQFFFNRVQSGKYTIHFSHIGFYDKNYLFNSEIDDIRKVNIVMQRKDIVLDEISVEANSYKPAVKEIYSQELRNYTNAYDALQNISGINIIKTDEIKTSVSLRGSSSNQVTIMMDGIELNNSMDQSFNLAEIPSEIIEKIEIYKNGNVELSNKSIGGIINIITKNDFDIFSFKTDFFAKYYISDRDRFNFDRVNNFSGNSSLSFQMFDYNVFFSYSNKRNENEWSYINAAKADRYRYINNPNIPRTQLNNYNYQDNFMLSVKSIRLDNSLFEYSFSSTYSKVKSGMPGWYDTAYEAAKTGKVTSNNRLFTKCYFNKQTYISLDLFLNYNENFFYIQEISPFFYTNNRDELIKNGFKLKYNYLGFINAKTGFYYDNESLSSEKLSDKSISREEWSHFISLDKTFDNLDNANSFIRTDMGLRTIYQNSEFSFFYTGNIFSRINFFDFSVIPNIGLSRNYRLPDFSSLFWADNMFSSGNPDLLPEYSLSKEVGLKISYNNYFFIFCNYFDKDIKNLIIWKKHSNGKYIPENVNSADISGYEIGFNYNLFNNFVELNSSLDLLEAISYTGKNSTDGKIIIYKPESIFNSNIKMNYKSYSLSINPRYTGSMFLNATNSIDIDPFWLVSSSFEYLFIYNKWEYSLILNGNNIFDEQYQVIYGYPMPGRSIEIGLKIKI